MKYCAVISNELMEYCHIIYKNNKGLVVDPGFNGIGVAQKLQELGLESIDILISHCHFDHYVGTNEVLKAFPNANVYVHQSSIPVVEHGNMWFEDACEKRFNFAKKPLFYKDKMELQGFKLKVDWIPGHTIESVCITLEEHNAIIVGDTIFRNTIGRCDYFTANIEFLDETLKYFEKIDGDTLVFQGHDEPFPLKESFEQNLFFTRWRNQTVPDMRKINMSVEIDKALQDKVKDDKDYKDWLDVQQLLLTQKAYHDQFSTYPDKTYTSGLNWNKVIYQTFATGDLKHMNGLKKNNDISLEDLVAFMKYTLMANLRIYETNVNNSKIDKWAKIMLNTMK